MSTDSNTHAFSSSSVMTYSKVGDEPAKVFQASSQTRCAPGGVSTEEQGLKYYIFVNIEQLLLEYSF